jgi:hypothetical protein
MTRFVTLLSGSCVLLALAVPPTARAQASAPPAQPPAKASKPAPATGLEDLQPTSEEDKESIEAGKRWLELLDADQAGAAWDSASKQLRSIVKRDKFIADVRSVRKPLGKLASRTPLKFARAHELPGAPAGDYALIEFEAKFANGKRLTEQLVWSAESGDTWRVAGYYYR